MRAQRTALVAVTSPTATPCVIITPGSGVGSGAGVSAGLELLSAMTSPKAAASLGPIGTAVTPNRKIRIPVMASNAAAAASPSRMEVTNVVKASRH